MRQYLTISRSRLSMTARPPPISTSARAQVACTRGARALSRRCARHVDALTTRWRGPRRRTRSLCGSETARRLLTRLTAADLSLFTMSSTAPCTPRRPSTACCSAALPAAHTMPAQPLPLSLAPLILTLLLLGLPTKPPHSLLLLATPPRSMQPLCIPRRSTASLLPPSSATSLRTDRHTRTTTSTNSKVMIPLLLLIDVEEIQSCVLTQWIPGHKVLATESLDAVSFRFLAGSYSFVSLKRLGLRVDSDGLVRDCSSHHQPPE